MSDLAQYPTHVCSTLQLSHVILSNKFMSAWWMFADFKLWREQCSVTMVFELFRTFENVLNEKYTNIKGINNYL